MKIGYQGSPGAFSEQAAQKFTSDKSRKFIQCEDFSQVVGKVLDGSLGYGVLAIENAISGGITENYNLLIENRLYIAAEVILPIHHNLLAIPGASLNDIKTVYSHPQALLQCKNFIQKMGFESKVFYDTAGSAKKVQELKDKSVAAVASSKAAENYSLKILKKNIEDDHENYTRFVIVSKKKSTVGTKSTIIIKLPHKKGSLVDFLDTLRDARLNLTKIESRPIIGYPWEYMFVIEFEGKLQEPFLTRAKSRTGLWKDLGYYNSI